MVIGNASVGFHITPTIPQQILIVKLLLRHYTSVVRLTLLYVW
jgi:hypothetical protein